MIPDQRKPGSSAFFDLRSEFGQRINIILNAGFRIEQVNAFYDDLPMLGTRIVDRVNTVFSYNKKMRFLFYLLLGLPGGLTVFVRNGFSRFVKRSNKEYCTNLLVTLSLVGALASDYRE